MLKSHLPLMLLSAIYRGVFISFTSLLDNLIHYIHSFLYCSMLFHHLIPANSPTW